MNALGELSAQIEATQELIRLLNERADDLKARRQNIGLMHKALLAEEQQLEADFKAAKAKITDLIARANAEIRAQTER